MIITNLHIRKTLQLAPIVLLVLVLADLILYFIPEFLGGLKINGYMTTFILAAIIGFYAYAGYPMFSMNLKKDQITFRSHLALSSLFGKTLSVPRVNLLNLEIDKSGFRDKLIVSYLNKHGEEAQQRFSITILSDRKKRMLQEAVEDFQKEQSPQNLHLFI